MSKNRMLKTIALIVLLSFLVTVSAAIAASATTYTKGQKVQVEWKGKWYASTILEVGTDANAGKYKIHYDGWGSEWDEWVGPSRMKPTK